MWRRLRLKNANKAKAAEPPVRRTTPSAAQPARIRSGPRDLSPNLFDSFLGGRQVQMSRDTERELRLESFHVPHNPKRARGSVQQPNTPVPLDNRIKPATSGPKKLKRDAQPRRHPKGGDEEWKSAKKALVTSVRARMDRDQALKFVMLVAQHHGIHVRIRRRSDPFGLIHNVLAPPDDHSGDPTPL